MKIIKYIKKKLKKKNIIPLNNKILGTTPKLENSKIIFNGDNNLLYCEKNVILKDSKLEFNANNSIIYLSSNRNEYKLNISVNNNCSFYIGKDNYINQPLTAIVSEETNVIIGNNGVFSLGLWFRTADPHLIYDIKTKKRINESKSIYIGDHVWLGQNALILKGTQIDSGSIIGANAVVSNKIIKNNETWAGNPIKKVKDNIFWDGKCVHKWIEKETNLSNNYKDICGDKPVDIYTYKFNLKQHLSYNNIEKDLKNINVEQKVEYFKELSSNNNKNRFVRK